MDYGPKKLMKDDVLWFIRVFTNDVFEVKIFMVALVGALVFHTVSFLVQICCFLREPHLFAQYGPHFFANFYGLCSGVVMLWKQKTWATLWENLDRWDISSAGPKVETIIRNGAKQIFIFVLINTSIGLISAILLVIPGSYDEKFYFVNFIILRKLPYLRKYSWVVTMLYKFTLLPMGLAMLLPPYLLIYSVQHSKFQILLGMFYVANANFGFDHFTDYVLAASSLYQDTISERLHFCLKRQVELMGWGFKLRKEVTGLTSAIVSVSGFLLGLAIIFTFIELEYFGNSMLLISWEALFSVVTLSTFFSVIHSGQSIEDHMGRIDKEAQNLKWYIWNTKNRKLFLQAQLAFMTPFKISIYGKYAINYDLAVSMLKGLYSITSVFISVKRH